MAGGDQKDNPVAINVVPMVDVIFCLCVFFMCSLKFKQLEGLFDTWLPLDKGKGGPPPQDLIPEIRVAVLWDATQNKVKRLLGERVINSDEELEKYVIEKRDDFYKLGKTDIPATVDCEPKVPWNEVVKIVNICKRAEIAHVEFAMSVRGSG